MNFLCYIYIYKKYILRNIYISSCRYAREGHLSYYKLDHLIPPEVILTKNEINFLSQAMDITHKGMRKVIERMANFLNVTQIICPDFLSLITRYCKELHLPGINIV